MGVGWSHQGLVSHWQKPLPSGWGKFPGWLAHSMASAPWAGWGGRTCRSLGCQLSESCRIMASLSCSQGDWYVFTSFSFCWLDLEEIFVCRVLVTHFPPSVLKKQPSEKAIVAINLQIENYQSEDRKIGSERGRHLPGVTQPGSDAQLKRQPKSLVFTHTCVLSTSSTTPCLQDSLALRFCCIICWVSVLASRLPW